ncbi:MAG: formate dehydrogenase accessory sulfurtransferase FdhD [Thermoanaerobaculia bacterium]|nr:formate dehydrogenase accessory sulfurtransferase FdhD [Thermoanaerobaculia bacterium]
MASLRTRLWPTWFYGDGAKQLLEDPVVVEEPLEILLHLHGEADPMPLTVTMRTPGDDVELVAGLLYTEGIVERPTDIVRMETEADPNRPTENRVTAYLAAGIGLEQHEIARSFLSNSACGVCGKSAVDSIFIHRLPNLPSGPHVAPDVLQRLPSLMRSGQDTFQRTGGIHAAALFDERGELLLLREDVGRHNAVDKLIGTLLLEGRLPVAPSILLASGRIGFEITQKVLRAGIPILAAVGAPTSLSLRLAERGGLTLIGFLGEDRLNLYTHPARLKPSST